MVDRAEQVRPGRRGRLHLPPVTGHQRDPRAGHRRQPRPGRALQRALLVRLRLRPRCPDELALQGRPRVRGAGGHRHPPGRHRRVPVRAGAERARRGADDHDPDRPVPLGTAVGHAAGVPVSDVREPVENEDIATFTATFAGGADRHVLGVQDRLRPGRTRSASRCSAERGAAAFDLDRAAEFTIADQAPAGPVNGYRQVLVGPAHPYITRGLPMDFPSVGHGQNDFFTFQARAFLDEIAGLDRLPRCPRLAEGLHNLRVLDAVVAAARGEARPSRPRRARGIPRETAASHERNSHEARRLHGVPARPVPARDPEDPAGAGPDQRRDQRRRVHPGAAPAGRAAAVRRRPPARTTWASSSRPGSR